MPDDRSDHRPPRRPWDPPPAPRPGGGRFLGRLIVIAAVVGGLLLASWSFLAPSEISTPRQIDAVRLGLILAVVVCGLAAARTRLSVLVRQMAAWLAIMAVLVAGYAYRDELTLVGQRIGGELVPQRGVRSPDGAMTFRAAADRHFWIEAEVDGVPVKFLVDTGASRIALSLADARRLGFDPARLAFTERLNTANGVALGAPVHLRRIRVGTIELSDLGAYVNDGEMPQSLLGMNFLERLGSIEIKDDRLTIRP
jgi:aspartyl protease family protein